MSNILEVIAALGEIRGAVSALKNKKTRLEFGYANKHFAEIGQALSEIYFSDEGILAVLRAIVNDKQITDADLDRLVEFNQLEEPVRHALGKLVLDYGKNARNSIKQSVIFGKIRSQKIAVRSAIQAAINEALTFEKDVDIKEVAELVSEIEKLNTVIQEAEHELRYFS